MKKLILILSFIFTVTIFANNSLSKRIEVSGTSKKEITPDIAKI